MLSPCYSKDQEKIDDHDSIDDHDTTRDQVSSISAMFS